MECVQYTHRRIHSHWRIPRQRIVHRRLVGALYNGAAQLVVGCPATSMPASSTATSTQAAVRREPAEAIHPFRTTPTNHITIAPNRSSYATDRSSHAEDARATSARREH